MRPLGIIALGLVLMLSLVGGCHPDVKPPPRPPEPPPFHPEPPRPSEPLPKSLPPAPGPLESTGQHTVHEGEADSVTRELLCFAYSEFYDQSTGEIRLPSMDGFIHDVFEKLRPRSEEEQLMGTAGHAYELVQNLAAGEIQAVAESLACA
jgi:hypothetical protein